MEIILCASNISKSGRDLSRTRYCVKGVNFRNNTGTKLITLRMASHWMCGPGKGLCYHSITTRQLGHVVISRKDQGRSEVRSGDLRNE